MRRTLDILSRRAYNVLYMGSSYPTVMVGLLVRERREQAGLTQRELAKRCGTTARTIRAVEAGRMPRPDLRVALAAALPDGKDVAA